MRSSPRLSGPACRSTSPRSPERPRHLSPARCGSTTADGSRPLLGGAARTKRLLQERSAGAPAWWHELKPTWCDLLSLPGNDSRRPLPTHFADFAPHLLLSPTGPLLDMKAVIGPLKPVHR